MEKIHVLVTVPLEKSHLEMIAAVDPSVEVRYAMEAVRAERGVPPSPGFTLYPHLAQDELTAKEASEALDRMLVDTEVIFGWRAPLNVVSRAPRLAWVQSTGAGVDFIAKGTGLLESDVILTGSSGVPTVSVAEFALCLMLMLAKNTRRLFANQQAHRWQPAIAPKLRDKTLGVVGLGSIGSEIARLARAFNMRVLASRRSATERQKNTAGVDEIFPAGELLQMLPMCDYVVLVTPLTPETRGLIGEAELKAMKPEAYLINVGRGPLIKQDALIQALKEGWIAGAALDVFETEPLPPESELWELPNLIISPHTAGYSERNLTPMTEFFCENLRRYLAGRELLNVIDKKKGY